MSGGAGRLVVLWGPGDGIFKMLEMDGDGMKLELFSVTCEDIPWVLCFHVDRRVRGTRSICSAV